MRFCDMTNAPPSPAVIVLNWNGHQDTLDCLESLAKTDPRPAMVVVVDNASTDDSLTRIGNWAKSRSLPHQTIRVRGDDAHPGPSADLPWLIVLACDANRGFAGGNNVGLRYLLRMPSCRHILLLNNDATVAPDFFAHLARALHEVPEAGLVTGTIFEAGQPNRVWYAGGRFLPHRALVAHNLEVPPGNDLLETDFVTGCAMLISRRALDEVGLLAECYFPVYVEDAEYSYRVKQAGLPVVYAPLARAYHKVGSTVGRACPTPRVVLWKNRHRLFFVRRNLRGATRVAALLYMAITKPGRALLETISGRPRIGWATLRGTFAGFFGRCDRPRA
jgi:GT2 family glycosyltransferase